MRTEYFCICVCVYKISITLQQPPTCGAQTLDIFKSQIKTFLFVKFY